MERKTLWIVGLLTLTITTPWRVLGDGVSRFGSPPPEPEPGQAKINTLDGATAEEKEWGGGTHGGWGVREGIVSRAPASASVRTDAEPGSALDAVLKNKTGIQEVSIIANDLGYFPKTIFVNRDIPVRLFVTGASKQSLCFMMDGFQVRKQLKANRVEEVEFTPKAPGRYRFYCPMYGGMEGIMVVRELQDRVIASE